MLERSQSLVLRVIVQTSFDGQILKSISGPESLYHHEYTGNHIVIFEAQLKSPPTMALIDHSLNEYINLHRINFRDWRIVDIDNFMKGNSFFGKIVKEGDWAADFEQKMGKPEKQVVDLKDQEEVKQFNEHMNTYIAYLNKKEPRSNRGIEKMISKAEYDLLEQARLEKSQETKKKVQAKEAETAAK